jgi:hypothetical protein
LKAVAVTDKQAVHAGYERARRTFHELVEQATDAELRQPTNGTRWNNRQMLFHMLLGYLILWALMLLVRIVNRLPDAASRGFARLLNAGTTPFDAVNLAGSWLAGNVLTGSQMTAMFDGVIATLHRRLDHETDTALARGMHYPTRWDPFFRDYMTLADIYAYPTQHFDFHRRQLTLSTA